MKLEITIEKKPISVIGNFEPEPPFNMGDVTVTIDGKVCPPNIRDVIVMGMAQKAGIVGLTFAEIVEEYLK